MMESGVEENQSATQPPEEEKQSPAPAAAAEPKNEVEGGTPSAPEESKEEGKGNTQRVILKEIDEAREAISQKEEPEKGRLESLHSLQNNRVSLYLDYLKDLRHLELRYETLYTPIYQQRKDLTPKLPEFWLKALKNNYMVKDYVHEKDEELLKFLVDVRCVEDVNSDDFVLEFEFTENPFMENTVLVKTFKHDMDQDLEKAEGTEIQWKGEDFTEKKIKKKKKSKGKTKITIKTVPNPSFFSFFKTKTDNHDHEDHDEEEDDIEPVDTAFLMMEEDEEVGVEIRDEVIPNALLYYLGVRKKDMMEDESGDDERSDSDDDKSRPVRKKSKNKEKKEVDASGKKAEECKNQ